jgi:hypothetical protein
LVDILTLAVSWLRRLAFLPLLSYVLEFRHGCKEGSKLCRYKKFETICCAASWRATIHYQNPAVPKVAYFWKTDVLLMAHMAKIGVETVGVKVYVVDNTR